jgi:hypothetical protein
LIFKNSTYDETYDKTYNDDWAKNFNIIVINDNFYEITKRKIF